MSKKPEHVSSQAGGFTKTLQWLGVLLPLVLSYPLLPVDGVRAWFKPRVLRAAALWLILAAWLLIRRDWRGAATITALYVVVDAWLIAFVSSRHRPAARTSVTAD